MDALISVIMPVYKVEYDFLKNSIQSVLNQRYQAIELILVDDGSPDDCGKICDLYQKTDHRVRVIHTANQGVSAARNTGLSACRGEYIMFVDSDDYLDDTFLLDLYSVGQRYQADCVIGGCVETEKTGDAPEAHRDDFDVKLLGARELTNALFYMEHPFAGFELTAVWGTLYRKSALEGAKFNVKMRIGEDFAFRYQVFQRIDKAACIDVRGYHYLKRNSSAMRNGFQTNKLETIPELEKLICETDDPEYRAGVISRSVNIAIVILFMIPIEETYRNERSRVVHFIGAYKKETLKNPRTRGKVRIALWLSALGFDFVQRLFSLLKR